MKNKVKYFIKGFDYLRVYNSPFKPPKIKLYFGKVAIGTPIFFPRKWVKFTQVDRVEAAIKNINDPKKVVKSFNEWYEHYKGYSKAIPKKIGFDFVSLGWKTKYDSYRHEWNPLISFVFFKWQIALMFIPEHDMHYWESWLYYTRETDKSAPIAERIAQCRKEAPQTWSRMTNPIGTKETIDYYELILKDKYNG